MNLNIVTLHEDIYMCTHLHIPMYELVLKRYRLNEETIKKKKKKFGLWEMGRVENISVHSCKPKIKIE